MTRSNENRIRKALSKITKQRNEIFKIFEALESVDDINKEIDLDIKINEILTKISEEANKAYWG